jgi:hypothetical protein
LDHQKRVVQRKNERREKYKKSVEKLNELRYFLQTGNAFNKSKIFKAIRKLSDLNVLERT